MAVCGGMSQVVSGRSVPGATGAAGIEHGTDQFNVAFGVAQVGEDFRENDHFQPGAGISRHVPRGAGDELRLRGPSRAGDVVGVFGEVDSVPPANPGYGFELLPVALIKPG